MSEPNLNGDPRSMGQLHGYAPEPCQNCGEYMLVPDSVSRLNCDGCEASQPYDPLEEIDPLTRALQQPIRINVVGLPAGVNEFYASMGAYFKHRSR